MVGWLASFRSTEAGVDLLLSSAWRASRADWLALEARPGQTRVDGREAGSVGDDEALRRGEVAGQGVGGQVRGCRQGGHLAVQGRDGGGVGTYVGGVLGACLQGRVLRQHGGELPCGDALQLDDRGLGDAVVQHSARECGRE